MEITFAATFATMVANSSAPSEHLAFIKYLRAYLLRDFVYFGEMTRREAVATRHGKRNIAVHAICDSCIRIFNSLNEGVFEIVCILL